MEPAPIDVRRLAPGRLAGSYTLDEMRAFAKRLNLPVSGSKQDLYNRLIAVVNVVNAPKLNPLPPTRPRSPPQPRAPSPKQQPRARIPSPKQRNPFTIPYTKEEIAKCPVNDFNKIVDAITDDEVSIDQLIILPERDQVNCFNVETLYNATRNGKFINPITTNPLSADIIDAINKYGNKLSRDYNLVRGNASKRITLDVNRDLGELILEAIRSVPSGFDNALNYDFRVQLDNGDVVSLYNYDLATTQIRDVPFADQNIQVIPTTEHNRISTALLKYSDNKGFEEGIRARFMIEGTEPVLPAAVQPLQPQYQPDENEAEEEGGEEQPIIQPAIRGQRFTTEQRNGYRRLADEAAIEKVLSMIDGFYNGVYDGEQFLKVIKQRIPGVISANAAHAIEDLLPVEVLDPQAHIRHYIYSRVYDKNNLRQHYGVEGYYAELDPYNNNYFQLFG